ncbi:hypothetical protein BDR05DRAFT_1004944 [Suillus weaverae]|nr:hypothetical protein BDR05DRAFT_1004944 [Suillus weaverae]
MADEEVANTSPDMQRCTMQWKEYIISFGGNSYTVFDTIGLEEPQLGIKEYLESVENAYRLIKVLDRRGGIDLLLFCVRAGRVTATLQSNYRLFHEFLCEKKVPIVLAITNLEREQRMEDWWVRNHSTFEKYQIHVAGHACITAANRLDGRHRVLYEESRTTMRDLVKKFTADEQKEAWMGGDNLFVSLIRKLKELLVGNVKKRDLVSHLTKRCGISLDVARQLASMIRQDDPDRACEWKVLVSLIQRPPDSLDNVFSLLGPERFSVASLLSAWFSPCFTRPSSLCYIASQGFVDALLLLGFIVNDKTRMDLSDHRSRNPNTHIAMLTGWQLSGGSLRGLRATSDKVDIQSSGMACGLGSFALIPD